ncbi:hypothetical protein [Streptomyces sp. NBC_01214]|uniref:hypothetical protein n=1 Tax=Streptomyces sp. NBC_01214 TaxID=2903777 RepID=UPI00224F997E|nr:hypothetical protein [Streptomyces sp. NBC_01214]
MARYRNGVLSARGIPPEMLARALDVACLGSARPLGMSGLMLTQGSDEARQFALGLEERTLSVRDKPVSCTGWTDSPT